MSERRHASTGDGEQRPNEGEPQFKVVDRRRFTPEGVAIETAGAEPAAASEEMLPAAEAQAADERDATIAEQAARIEELSRAYASLVEDNKAFRQRLEREKNRVVEAERFDVVRVLLEASDDLDRALAAVSGAAEGGEALRALVEGVRVSLAAMQRRIADLGAERIGVLGQPFDPRVAEAVDTVAVADEDQDGIVIHEVRPGYRVGDRVLRPARVRVGRLARA